jgi:hypothetical protein
MATAVNQLTPPQPPILDARQGKPQLVQPAQIVPVKIALSGEQGAGKTTTAGLIAAALSKLYHNGAPIHVTDPELGWKFLPPIIFNKEGITLVQRTVPTYAAMLKDLRDAEREGACVWAVELGKIWKELLKTLQKAKPNSWGSELGYMWDDFVAQFLNSPLHCLVLGRIQDIVEEVMTETGAIKSVKVGEGLKAGGQKNNFAYEPHLVIRMTLETKPRVKKGKTFEDEGRMVHRAQITKDRTWALNGRVFRWPDRDGYKAGEFRYVWDSLRPHWAATQLTAPVKLDTTASSESILTPDGDSEYYARRQRKDVLVAELHATMEKLWGGQGREEKRTRIVVFEHIFGFKSKEAADAAKLETIERGVRILQLFEKRRKDGQFTMPTTEAGVLAEVDNAINAYEQGKIEDLEDLPF